SQLLLEKTGREKAEAKLKDLLRRLFGPKSEKLDPNQFRLALGQVEADSTLATEQPPAPATVDAAKASPAKRKGGGRRAAPAHLPVETTVIDLPEAEKAGLVKIREEITEE